MRDLLSRQETVHRVESRPPLVLRGQRQPLDAAGAALRDGRGVLLYGPAGSGRTTLVEALARRLGPDVTWLSCSPAEDDARLPFVGLVDLFTGVPDEVFRDLAPEPARVLRDVLLGTRASVDEHDGLALRVAVTRTLRRLGRYGPAALVVDGLHWLDEQSADVLSFAVRRLHGTAVRVLATERVAPGGQPGRPWCCPPDTAEIPLRPLPDSDIAMLLASMGGSTLPAGTVRVVQELAAGNPRYARELGRGAHLDGMLAADGSPRVPVRLRASILAPARALPAPALRTLLVCCAAVHPDLTLLRAAGIADAEAHLGAAERAGVASVGADGTVAFAHPLLRAALYADASTRERRVAHALLADAVTDPRRMAHHLVLAHPYENEAVAARVMAAAEAAHAGGALEDAADLAGIAAERTPSRTGPRAGAGSGRDSSSRDGRSLRAAEYACDAGRRDTSERLARSVLRSSPSPRHRVAARIVLLRNAGQALEGFQEVLSGGFRDAAGDDVLTGRLHHWAALRCLIVGEPPAAAAHARRAATEAAIGADPVTGLSALTTLARVQSLTGRTDEARATLDRALSLAAREGGPRRRGMVRMRAVLSLDGDRVGEARARMAELLGDEDEYAYEPDAAEYTSVEDRVATLLALVRIQVRAGECRAALRTAARCARTAGDAGAVSAPALYALALAASVGSTADEAGPLTADAVRASEADGDRLFLLRALAAQAQTALFGGGLQGAADAVEILLRVKGIAADIGVADPPLLHWTADLAEAHVMLGDAEAADAVLKDGRRHVHAGSPGSVTAALERAEGLREAARGRAKEGAELVRAAADRLRPLDLPVDLLRTLIALGTVERRARHRTAANRALTEALDLAETHGVVPLAARARAELARLGALEGGGAAALTATETRIAELVTGGASNREVAAKLFISVKTVEGNLSRVYRKIGVRSRTALARAMALSAEATAAPPADARPGAPTGNRGQGQSQGA
ncbi:helix-turn-helix transcriptional regulator [Streptomyces sp. 8L]|uniref:helix-turn-helix transcriptional regulator n=1 Tax=Streptomyces sp. 8L TaxID=2877242 RepID=UPI001CD57C47|nr:LuxR family transcriptional regulator [Streptomyces sp. 8L]MCA1222112.1 AAA family ATPase [Streptomyces sp. 8L]